MSLEQKIQELRSQRERNPGAIVVKVALAEALFRSAVGPSQEPEEALQRLNEAIGLDPFRPAFYYHRGLQWHRLANTNHALSNYGRALQFDPKNIRILHQMALAHLDAGRYDEARKKWDEAEKILCTKVEKDNNKEGGESRERAQFLIQCGRSEAAMREGKAGDALSLLRKAIPPASCASLVGEMVLKYVLITGSVQPVLEWLEKALDPSLCISILNRLQPWLDAYQSDLKDSPLLQIPLESSSYPVQVLRAIVAFDRVTQNGTQAKNPVSEFAPVVSANRETGTMVHAFLALLDCEAQRLYRQGEWSEASAFWRQALLYEPYNTAVAHNLAVTATRAKIEPDYYRWWKRAEQLWYTRLFILPQVESYRKLITEKHLAFAVKAAEAAKKSTAIPSVLQAAWVWVDEMEKFFLCEQYCFRSAYHLLGVLESSPQEAIEEAYRVMQEKTRIYSNNTLPALKDALQVTRLEKLEHAYEAIRTPEARRTYKCLQHKEEMVAARKLRDRKVTYLISLVEFFETKMKEVPVQKADEYVLFTERLLAHPFKALRRQFQDAGKADATSEASERFRSILAEFYIEKIPELAETSEEESAEWNQAQQLLRHLHELNPRDWRSLYHWGQSEWLLYNVEEALERVSEAFQKCDHIPSRTRIEKELEQMKLNADARTVNRYLNPAVEHMNQEHWKEAIPLLQTALSRKPDLAILHFYLARCCLETEQPSDARRHVETGEKFADTTELREQFSKLKGILPDLEVAPFHKRAQACMKNQDWNGAMNHLDQGIAANGNHALIQTTRAYCLLARHLEAMRQETEPRTRSTLRDVHAALNAARDCPNAEQFENDMQTVKKQLDEVEKQL